MSKIIYGIFIGLFVGLIVGYFITTNFLAEPIPDDYVRVMVVNKSNHEVKLLTLIHQGGEMKIQKFCKGESEKLLFRNRGEGTYHIIAILDSDTTLTSKELYIEGGYRTTENIYNDHIQSIQ